MRRIPPLASSASACQQLRSRYRRRTIDLTIFVLHLHDLTIFVLHLHDSASMLSTSDNNFFFFFFSRTKPNRQFASSKDGK